MKWNEYSPLWKRVATKLGKPKHIGWEEAIRTITDGISRLDTGKFHKEHKASILFGISHEREWMLSGRPYYDLYPSVIEAFLRVDLNKILGRHISLPPHVMVRLPLGRTLGTGQLSIGAFLVCFQSRESDGTKCIGICSGMPKDTILFSMPAPDDGAISHEIETFTAPDMYRTDYEDFKVTATSIMKIVCSLSLIQHNPDLIEPLPLEADAEKFEAATDFDRLKLLDKAKRRGKIGWAVGRKIQTVAGVRCPHFAIRWMGHGEPKTPVLRPISGCIVNRKKLSEVPTGYLDDETSI